MSDKIDRIEVTFQVPVNLPDGFEQRLSELLGEVCEDYKEQNPKRTMWLFGWGGKILWNEPREPDIDMSVLSIEVAEREKY